MKNLIGIILVWYLYLTPVFGQTNKSPQTMGASFVKKLIEKEKSISIENRPLMKTNTASRIEKTGEKSGATIIPVALDEELGIHQFDRSTAKKHLDRDLFGSPQNTATYYYTEYDARYNLIENTYIQLVSDPRWDRILYGALNGALKSYTQLNNPGEIVVNSVGRVFIADRGNSKVRVLDLKGKEDNINLEFVYNIEDAGSVSSLTYNDGGSPFDLSDDYLYIVDAFNSSINQYKLDTNSAQKENSFNGLKWPSSISFGRSNGSNNNKLYVIDNYSKRVTLYEVSGDRLIKNAVLQGQSSQAFSSIECDHFGQIYIADNVNNEISKYTADLTFLDIHKSGKTGFSDISIPFGTIKFHGEEKYWAGFDQLLALQNWTETSGLQRYKLATAIKDFTLDISDDNASINSHFTITDYSNIKIRVKHQGKIVYDHQENHKPSGEQSISWNRKKIDNQQAAAGDYSLQIEFESIYDEAFIAKQVSFYLPLFYRIECGYEDDTKAIQRVKGKTAEYNGVKVLEDNGYIEYKVSGLNPEANYEIAVEYIKGNGADRKQQLIVDGDLLQETILNSEGRVKSLFKEINSAGYSDGAISIVVSNPQGGLASASHIWVKENSRQFSVESDIIDLPTNYALAQNFPNPFNPSTKIQFDLPEASKVNLVVFDVLGRKVSELLNKTLDAGVHSVEFNGSVLASGVYFYRIEAGSYKHIKRMLLIK